MADKSDIIYIIKELNSIAESLKNLNDRLDRLEGKTDDIHQYVPFVGWLEAVGKAMPKLSWLRGVPSQPTIENISNSPEDSVIKE